MLFWLLACAEPKPEAVPEEKAHLDVVLVVIETWRVDRLALGGHHRDTMPFVESLAARGTVWTHAVAPAPWTLPSVASISTGKWPHETGVVRTEHALAADHETLAEAMSARGYQTAFVGVNELLTHDRGLDQGFDTYEAFTGLSADGVRKEILDIPRDDRPLFLQLHLFEPHCPYWPPRSHRGLYPVADEPLVTDEMLAATVDCHIVPDERRLDAWFSHYDAELTALDGQLERILRDRGDARIVLVGDHGEAFWEHGTIGHGAELVDEVLRVPLIAVEPGQAPQRFDEPISTREVYRLVLQQALQTEVLSETSQTSPRQCLGEARSCATPVAEAPTVDLSPEAFKALEALGYTEVIGSTDPGETP